LTESGRAEKLFLGVSVVLFFGGLAWAARGGEAVRWAHPRVFAPAGLLSLAAVNVRLRSKVLGWGLFAAAFVLFMVVFGPWVLGVRASAGAETLKFMRAMAMYLSLALTGLFQLRAARRQ
jgi:hypothetical protein